MSYDSLCSSKVGFPLTPALSLREREPRAQCSGKSRRSSLADESTVILPLPKGEGGGEGKLDDLPIGPLDIMNFLVPTLASWRLGAETGGLNLAGDFKR